MAVRINDISGNVDITYLATTINQCQNDTDKQVFKLVEETGEVITMGKVIGEPVKQTAEDAAWLISEGRDQNPAHRTPPSQRDIDVADACIEAAKPVETISIKMTWLGTLNALLALYTDGDRQYAITELRRMATCADAYADEHIKSKEPQSELLDIVDHLNKAAELASSLESTYAAMEPFLDEDLDDEPPVWVAAQDMIDKLQPIIQLDDTAGELEEAQQSITDADDDDSRKQYGERR